MKIGILKDCETIRYAAEEMKKYLEMMDYGMHIDIVTGVGDINFGLLEDLGLRCDDVADAMYDDVIDINIEKMQGYIAGSNERSILMGVYNFLKSAGCMWVRPGKKGEFIPKVEMTAHSFQFRKKADYAFRGQCIEGAVSYENVKDTVEWLPKVNMNFFMMEQVIPYNYMSRWYKHNVSTIKEDEGTTFEEIGEYVLMLEKFIKKCGLQLHALGHGYLLEPYGIHYKTSSDKYELSQEAKEDIALVNGKRELYHGSPNFTQLCFSKDRARLGMVKYLTEYLEKKPYIDFLHVYLSDAANNHCECENCKKKTPTDFYVQILNELDAELTKRNIASKIVFIMYQDTLWAPEITKLINPERFIMSTASTRDYNETYRTDRSNEPLPPYVRNDFRMKLDFSITLKFMDAWKETFNGPRFLYEYYMYTDHYFDPGHMSISRNILTDVKAVHSIEFDGIMSDQTQRAYFPTALPNAVMGEGLFDASLDFDNYANAFFAASYGEDSQKVRVYLENITKVFEPTSLRVKDSIIVQDTNTGKEVVRNPIKNNPETAQRLFGVAGLVDSFLPIIEENLKLENPCHKESWKILWYHAEYCKRLADIFMTLAKGEDDRAKEIFADMIDYLSNVEDEIQSCFDLVLFNQRVKQIINIR